MRSLIKIVLILCFSSLFTLFFFGGFLGSVLSKEFDLTIFIVVGLTPTLITGWILYKLFRWKIVPKVVDFRPATSPTIVEQPDSSGQDLSHDTKESRTAPAERPGISKARLKELREKYNKTPDKLSSKSSDKYLNGCRSLTSPTGRDIEIDSFRANRRTSIHSIPDFDERFEELDSKQEVTFRYPGSNGVSEREVLVYKQLDGEYINGYCSSSGGFRTFKIERMIGDIVDTTTGESYTKRAFSNYLFSQSNYPAGTSSFGHNDTAKDRETISFLGFSASTKEELVSLAKLNNFTVKSSSFSGLDESPDMVWEGPIDPIFRKQHEVIIELI